MSLLNRIDRKTALIVVSCLVMAVPVAVYIYVVMTYKASVPWRDDYDAVLNFLNSFATSPTLGGKLAAIWLQRNHRIVIPHLMYLIPYALSGKADFDFYILFANLGWLCAVGVLLGYLYRKYALPFWSLVPLPFMLFSLRLLDPMLFADSGMPVFWSLCFTILFFIALVEGRVGWACALFMMSFYTWGDGSVLYPLGLLYYVVHRQWKSLAIFGVIGLAGLLVYFTGFRLEVAGGVDHNMDLRQSLVFFLNFLGGVHLDLIPSFWEDLVLGAVLALGGLYFLIRRRTIDFPMLLIGLAVSTALVATYARGGFGAQRASISRYSAFSMLMVVALYVYVITAIKRPALKAAFAAVVALIMVVYWYRPIPAETAAKGGLYWQRKYRITYVAMYATDGVTSELNYAGNTDADHEFAASVLDESKRLGIYDPQSAADALKRK